jgi:hypothetical protein
VRTHTPAETLQLKAQAKECIGVVTLPTAVTETDGENNRIPVKIFEHLEHSRFHFLPVSVCFSAEIERASPLCVGDDEALCNSS